MKSFIETIQETSNDSIDNLRHAKLSKKRLKSLKKDTKAFEYWDIEDWKYFPPPKNSSEKTRKEIQYLISLGEFRTQWQTEMAEYDLKTIRPFKDYLDKYGIEIDWDRIKEFKDSSDKIILSLKRFYGRPRPKQVAEKLNLPLDTFPLKTAGTPSYPSGHATQGRLIALLVADDVPLEHKKNIMDIGKRIGESRQIAGAHYPSDTEFGHRLADSLYDYSKSAMEPDLTLEQLEEGIIRDAGEWVKKKLKRTFRAIKSWVKRAFNKLKRMAPGETTVITIPGLKHEEIFMSDKDEKVTLSEGSLQAIKGNYNEALVLQYIYEWTGKGVNISSKYEHHRRKIDSIVNKWDNDLKNKISNWKPAKKIIEKGSLDMTKYLVGTTLKNDAIIVGAYLDNLSYQGGAEFKADIQVAVVKEGKEILTGYSLKLYSNKSVGLANTSPKKLAGHLVGKDAEKDVENRIANDKELQLLIAAAKLADKKYKEAKKANPKDPEVKRGGKLYNARTEARSPVNPICARHAYDVIKPHVKDEDFGENLLRLIGFTDKDTKMLMAVTTKNKSEIIDAHPDLDVSNIDIEHVGVSIKIVGPTGKTIVSFGSKEGERKAMSGKVSFASIDPVDLADLPLGQN